LVSGDHILLLLNSADIFVVDDCRVCVCVVHADDVPIISQLEVTHTGVGLAWSYFYGYLNIVLPGNCTPLMYFVPCVARSVL